MSGRTFAVSSPRRGLRLQVAPDPTRRNYWVVTLTGDAVSATLSFAVLDHLGLASFFADLANAWRGWPAKKTWTSLERDVALHATHDGIGHVALTVEIREYRSPEWHCTAVLDLEAGQLAAIARDARCVV